MTTEQTYIKFLLKVNDNFENSNVAGDRGRFVVVFNEAQNKMIEYILDNKKNDESRYIQQILVPNHKILKTSSVEYADTFELPKNYFDLSSAYTKASNKTCKEQKINLYEIKDDNKVEILQDEFNKPSFIAREAPFSISSNRLHVYKDCFSNDELFISYYRYPVQIRTIVEDDPESPFNETFAPEFDDKFLDRIISMAASLFEGNSSDPKYQIDMQRALQKV
jgi:hypothetical protein